MFKIRMSSAILSRIIQISIYWVLWFIFGLLSMASNDPALLVLLFMPSCFFNDSLNYLRSCGFII